MSAWKAASNDLKLLNAVGMQGVHQHVQRLLDPC